MIAEIWINGAYAESILRYNISAYTLIADIACNALKMRCTAFLCAGSIVIPFWSVCVL